MRYYLDTNTLVFILYRKQNDLHLSVRKIIESPTNQFFVSSVVVKEILLLYRIGKLNTKLYKKEADLLDAIKKFDIKIILFSEQNLKQYTSLSIADGHKDMNDHAIIAQSISDRIPLISSDTKFNEYTKQGLSFVYNKR